MTGLRLDTSILLAVLFVAAGACAKKNSMPTSADVDIPADAGIFPVPTERPPGAPQTDIYGDELPPGVIARLGTVRMRHTFGRVYMVKFAANGKTLMSHGEDGSIRLWDSQTGPEMARFPGVVPRADRPHPPAGLSPDGKILLTWDKGFHAWDTATSEELPWSLKRLSEPIFQLCSDFVFSNDGKSFMSVGLNFNKPNFEGKIQVRDVATGEVLHEQMQRLNRNRFPGRCLSPDGTTAAFRESDAAVLTLRNTATGRVLHRWELMDFAGFSPDGKKLLGVVYAQRGDPGPWRSITVKDIASGQEYCRFAELDNDWVVFSPDGKMLAVTNVHSPPNSKPSFLKVLDAATGQTLQKWPGCPQGTAQLRFTPDGNCLVSADRDNAIRVWDTAGGKIAYQLDLK